MITPANRRIGWIGTGVMGGPMCGHLVAAGYRVSVFNRTRQRAQTLVERGAEWRESPDAVARDSDAIFTMVGFPRDVREVILGPRGALAGARPGSILVDMTTSEPELAREIYGAARARGVASMDAPVSGGDVGAREARLSIMAGGDRETFERLVPIFEPLGKTVVYQGPAGSGQHSKMVNQILIATSMIGICEALLYATQAGLDLPSVLQSVASGAAASWALGNLAPRMLAGNFDPGFFVDHFVKDLGIALGEAKRMNLSLPGLALAEQLYLALQADGHGRKGTHALLLALAKLSNVEWKPPRPRP